MARPRPQPLSLVRHLTTGLALALGVFTFVTLLLPEGWGRGDSGPHPSLTPRQVVETQLQALRDNSPANEGIAEAYRFASAANREHTGPLGHFSTMLQSGSYQTLLNHLSADFGPTIQRNSHSYVPIVVTDDRGTSSAFIWVMSRSTHNDCGACWMTDAVIPAGSLHKIWFA